jgi:hypothetical protein
MITSLLTRDGGRKIYRRTILPSLFADQGVVNEQRKS